MDERNPKTFAGRYGPWALVSGADEAAAAEFAVQLAGRGLDLLLAGADEGALQLLGARLRRDQGVEAHVLSGDSSTPRYVRQLSRFLQRRQVGLLVCDVGTLVPTATLENDLGSEIVVAELNLRAPAQLAKLCGRQMARRGRGGMIFLATDPPASPVVPTPSPVGHHTALAEAFWYELAPHGVDVICVTVSAGGATGPEENALAPPVREALGELQHAGSRIPGGAATVMNQLGSWIFSEGPHRRLAGALVEAASRSNLN